MYVIWSSLPGKKEPPSRRSREEGLFFWASPKGKNRVFWGFFIGAELFFFRQRGASFFAAINPPGGNFWGPFCPNMGVYRYTSLLSGIRGFSPGGRPLPLGALIFGRFESLIKAPQGPLSWANLVLVRFFFRVLNQKKGPLWPIFPPYKFIYRGPPRPGFFSSI